MRDDLPGQSEVERLFAGFVDRLEQINARKRLRSSPDVDEDDALDRFTNKMLAHYGFREREPERAPLRLVTDSNAHEFEQAPKRRGRPPKVREGGNVVTLRSPKPRALPPAPDDARLRFRVRARAAGIALARLRDRENAGRYQGKSDYDECLVEAWRELGYSPP